MAKERAKREAIKTSARGMIQAAPVSSGKQYLRLPEGITLFQPEKGMTYYFRFLPWKASKYNRSAATPGDWVWNFFFQTHPRIGFNDESYTCLTTYRQVCPICLKCIQAKKGGKFGDKEHWKNHVLPLRSRNRELFLVHDTKGPKDNLMVWEESIENFGKYLREQIDFSPEFDNLADPEGNIVVAFKATEKKTDTSSFVECSTIKFGKVGGPISDAIFDQLLTLDVDSFVVRPNPKTLQDIVDAPPIEATPGVPSGTTSTGDFDTEFAEEPGLNGAAVEEEETAPPPRPARRATPPTKPAARQPAPAPEPEPTEEEEVAVDEEPAEEEAPAPRRAAGKPTPAARNMPRHSPEPETEEVETEEPTFDEEEWEEEETPPEKPPARPRR